jgi:hypothetical protein
MSLLSDSTVSSGLIVNAPDDLSTQGPSVRPEGADRWVGNLARLELTDGCAVDPRSFGHVRQAQALSLPRSPELSEGLGQFPIDNGRVFLSKRFDVSS